MENNLDLEKEEISLLLSEGYEFETSFLGKKKKWTIGKISVGKMIELSRIFIKIKVDEEGLASEDFGTQISTQYESVYNNAELTIDVMVLAIEDSYKEVYPKHVKKWFPNFIKKWFKKEIVLISKDEIKQNFLNEIDSKELKKFAFELYRFSDYQSFTLSTALMSGNRPTKALPIEK